jgi:hypothetical protein
MPRLVGKQSNPAIPLSLFILIAIAGLVGLEYAGIINVIDGFGNDRLEIRTDRDRP